jgi:hypothetical protein
LSDRRLLFESQSCTSELFRYEDVKQVHWMFKDGLRIAMRTADPQQEISRMKSVHFDRLEVELKGKDRAVVLEGLDQAYLPILEFLKLVNRIERPTHPR